MPEVELTKKLPINYFGKPEDFCLGEGYKYGNCELWSDEDETIVKCDICDKVFEVENDGEEEMYIPEEPSPALDFFTHDDEVVHKLDQIISLLEDREPVPQKTDDILNPFVGGNRFHDIIEMLLEKPLTVEEIYGNLHNVKGRKPSVVTLDKYLQKDLNMYAGFQIVKEFGKYKIEVRQGD